jgi:dTDP-4-amino-4,6-dideoxygalactose transaminase
VNSSLPLVDLASQQKMLAPELLATFASLIERTDWILGDELELFEREFADYCETRHAVGTDSGMSALELALRATGIGPGDEVITAANTFVATALAISHSGARPVLVDTDEQTYTMSPPLLEEAITERTKAVVPVHLYGHPADMRAIMSIAEEHGLLVIEDACQAHGARLDGRRVGSLARAAAFSFYPAKNLGAFGDGGALVTDDDEIAASARTLRDYGQSAKYQHVVKGFNRRLDTIQAAILRMKLERLDDWNAQRRSHAALYTRLLASTSVVTPGPSPSAEPVWHLYVVRVHARDRVQAALREQGIQTGIHYPIPVHLQPAYWDLGYPVGSFPVTERCADEVLSLPMYPELDEISIARVAGALEEATSASQDDLTAAARARLGSLHVARPASAPSSRRTR